MLYNKVIIKSYKMKQKKSFKEIVAGIRAALKDDEIELLDFHGNELRNGHDFRYSMSGEKLKGKGFRYKLTLKESLKKCVEWTIDKKNKRWINL